MKNSCPLWLLLCSFWFIVGFMILEPPDGNALLKGVSQNFLSYVSPTALNQTLVSHEEQDVLYKNYLTHYFSPWNDPELLYPKNSILEGELSAIRSFTTLPGWGANKQAHSTAWIKDIVQNMDVKTYPNTPRDAITVQVTQLRMLPTAEPSFDSEKKAGEGYPFDRISVSLAPANLPIKVIHLSKDHAWALVITPYQAMGWVPFDHFAWVDKDFMHLWQNDHYVAIIKDKVAFLNSEGNFLFFARMGSLYPVTNEEAKKYYLLAAISDSHHQAISQEVAVAKKDAINFPLSLTPKNLGELANLIMGQPYDWGGYYGYRDCSATLMDLFMPFGIWLPRNSQDQKRAVGFTSLQKLNVAAKEAYIEQHATPFLTFLWTPGHVVLYLGKKGAKSYVFHTLWGLPTQSWFEGDGRLIVGKTAITPLDFGEETYWTSSSLISRVDSMGNVVSKKS